MTLPVIGSSSVMGWDATGESKLRHSAHILAPLCGARPRISMMTLLGLPVSGPVDLASFFKTGNFTVLAYCCNAYSIMKRQVIHD